MNDGLLVDFLLENDIEIPIESNEYLNSKWLVQKDCSSGDYSMKKTKKTPRQKSKANKKRAKSLASQIDGTIEELFDLILSDGGQTQLGTGTSKMASQANHKPTARSKKKPRGKANNMIEASEDADLQIYESIAQDESFLFNFSLNDLSSDPNPKLPKGRKKHSKQHQKSSNVAGKDDLTKHSWPTQASRPAGEKSAMISPRKKTNEKDAAINNLRNSRVSGGATHDNRTIDPKLKNKSRKGRKKISGASTSKNEVEKLSKQDTNEKPKRSSSPSTRRKQKKGSSTKEPLVSVAQT
ncbi:LADA_0B11320g1_1 [Lachancea dasiensis]|uniref:LADA_0B11320g1_1 n=1 Tax=Lachancea dasiensis TaxID=1072105 RepID=A0A1G4IVL1_9SACH|nr:LADA_0B11320g1_1 [Lachancea dasiensis]